MRPMMIVDLRVSRSPVPTDLVVGSSLASRSSDEHPGQPTTETRCRRDDDPAILSGSKAMRPEADITDLIARARKGDEEAIGQLLTAFGEELRIMVRARLPRTLRTRFDSTDFVQAVW